MIEGLKVDLTADELTRVLEERIEYHKGVAVDCDARRVRLQVTRACDEGAPEGDGGDARSDEGDDTERQLAAAWPPYLEHLAQRAERHRDRAGALQFLRDHLISHEIYRLGEDDLVTLQLWPQGTAVHLAASDGN